VASWMDTGAPVARLAAAAQVWAGMLLHARYLDGTREAERPARTPTQAPTILRPAFSFEWRDHDANTTR
jgi:hypothetical protein